MEKESGAVFSNLLDLLAGSLGGQALACSDDFFASMDNLVKPGRGVFIPGKFTDRGKWMDGWESRRKRTEGHDWCVLKLGVPGSVHCFDIDTNHFLGNHPPFASVEGVWAPEAESVDDLPEDGWVDLLRVSPLRPGSQNVFLADETKDVTHLRLHIYPAGGVARFRAYGHPRPAWTVQDDDARFADQLRSGEVDLVAMRNGGRAKVCSDMFFGPMDNLIAPGRAENMGGGWESRRRRGPGYDWIILEAGDEGVPTMVVVDTNHFKGNYPARCSLWGIHDPSTPITELVAEDAGWSMILPEVPLDAHKEHVFRDQLKAGDSYTHYRFCIYPDGGVSRLRIYGQRLMAGMLSSLSDSAAEAALMRCCGSSRWVASMMSSRPFHSDQAVLQAATSCWRSLEKEDFLEAFEHHPQIGADIAQLRAKFQTTHGWSASEQSGISQASEATLQRLADGNRAYLEKFGYIFIVCATGKSADEMLEILNKRLPNTPAEELLIAAGEQEKITAIRLRKLPS